MEKKENLYVGNGKRVEWEGGDDYYRVELDLTELKEKMEDAHLRVWTGRDGREHKVIKLILAPMKPENCTEWKDQTLKIDTFVPDKTKARTKPRLRIEEPTNDVQEEIPF